MLFDWFVSKKCCTQDFTWARSQATLNECRMNYGRQHFEFSHSIFSNATHSLKVKIYKSQVVKPKFNTIILELTSLLLEYVSKHPRITFFCHCLMRFHWELDMIRVFRIVFDKYFFSFQIYSCNVQLYITVNWFRSMEISVLNIIIDLWNFLVPHSQKGKM